MHLTKISEDGIAESYRIEEREKESALYQKLIEQGFKPVVSYTPPKHLKLGALDSLEAELVESGDRYEERWVVRTDRRRVKERIERLKEELSATDYRVIKSYEYALVGEHPPYDVQLLHQEREALRRRINDLENL